MPAMVPQEFGQAELRLCGTVALNQQPLKIETRPRSFIQRLEMIMKYLSAAVLKNIHRPEIVTIIINLVQLVYFSVVSQSFCSSNCKITLNTSCRSSV